MNNNKDLNGLTQVEFLETYDINKYKRPSVTVDALIFTLADRLPNNYRKLPKKKLRILLVKRKGHPFIKQWALPGGFVGIDESLEEAVYREVEEETGVKDIYMEQLYTYGCPDRDPRGRVISVTYLSLVDMEKLSLAAGTDASDTDWFEMEFNSSADVYDTNDGIKSRHNMLTLKSKKETIYAEQLAFDHAEIIRQGIERLRNKLEYTDIVFHLMPEYFTLSELQKAYEEILGKPLLKANFRRKIAKMVVESDLINSDGGHRPSKLYTFNSNWRGES